MNVYVLLSWGACFLTLFLLIWSFIREKQLFIRPSIFFIIFFHFQVQWISAIKSEYIAEFLYNPWDYFYLVHLFPIAVILLSFLVGKRIAGRVVRSINSISVVTYQNNKALQILLGILLLGIILIFGWYITIVPFSQTGFYAMIFSLPNQDVIREETFKLLKNPLLTYIYSLMASVLAPIAAILLSFRIEKNMFPVRPFKLIINILGLFFIFVAVCIYGSKAPMIMLLLGIFWALYIKAGMPFSPVRIILIMLLLLLLPSIMSIFINNSSLTPEVFISYYMDIFDRAFGRIMLPGLWYVDYAQHNGYFGISAIPKIAYLFGVQSVDSSNIIGRQYISNSLESVSAGSSFIFTYYSYFGMYAFIPCIILTLLLDILLWIYLTLDKGIRIPIIAACSISAINLIQSQFTTVLFSGGIVPIIILGIIWTLFIKSTHHADSLPKVI